jgi:hypothetical protein
MYQPKTGQPCTCHRGIERDNCPQCEGTGQRIDFAAIRARTADPETINLALRQCAARLRATVIATAHLWDAARLLERTTGTEVDGLVNLVSDLAVAGAPTEAECSDALRCLFEIPE